MSTIKSSAENLTLNADGSGNDILIQSNGSTKAIVTAEGTLGIGIGSPTADLHIHNSADHTRLNIDCSNSSGDNWQFQSRNNGEFWLRNDDNSRNDIVVYPSTGYVAAKNGLLFGTDTAAANALDDYEEGTWTPACGVATVSGIERSRYTKIGRLVHVFAYFQLAANGSGSNISFTGLPFTVENEIYETGIAQFSKNSTSRGILARTGGNSTTINLIYTDGDQAEVPANTVDGGHVMISLTYNVA